MKTKTNIIRFVLLAILIVIIALWTKNNDNKSDLAETNVAIEQTKELNTISETSDSTNLDDLESDIDININLDDLNELENTLDSL